MIALDLCAGYTAMQATMAMGIAQNKYNAKVDPAATAVVTVPEPMKAADVIDQTTTLFQVLDFSLPKLINRYGWWGGLKHSR